METRDLSGYPSEALLDENAAVYDNMVVDGFTIKGKTLSKACLKVGTEACDGLFQGVGLIYSFGLGVTFVDCHEGAPEVGEGA